MSRAKSVQHVKMPITGRERTKAWYENVFI
jgi:hypothetical protein